MRIHGNTLYVQTAGAYLRKEGETVKVEVERETRLTVPLHHLDGIVCFGRVSMSPALMAECCELDIGISWMTDAGRFQCRVVGADSGNVLLRRQQYRLADAEATALPIARAIVAAKIQNSRTVLLRGAREAENSEAESTLRRAIDCAVLAALVQRKREELTHPLLDEKVAIGLLPLLQTRLLARHIRGELPAYPALIMK